MRKIFYGWVLSGLLLLALPVQAQTHEHEHAITEPTGLNIGDSAPTFEAKADNGKLWKSDAHVGKGILVVYFFPAALTGG
ncbi:MAG: hypothetical protein ACI8V2_004477 [Candidatus Latescibacterota bacterium]|jgi:hypothetical protein